MTRQLSVDSVKSKIDSYRERYSPSRFLATSKGRKVMKSVNTFKITVLCGLMTILVLRGTIMQPGSVFPDSSADEAGEEPFHVRSTARARVLQAQEDEVGASSGTGEAAIARGLVTESTWDPSTPYSLGPKISNWDKQREIWNKRNPGRNQTKDGKPKTLLVSGSQPKPCVNPMGDFYHLKFLKNRIDYARLHELELFYNVATFEEEMNSFWAKLPLLRKLMLNHPEVEWIWWMDSDAIFTDMTFAMPMAKYVGKNLILHGFQNMIFEQHQWLGLNTGSFLIRNCQWALDLLDVWAPFGPNGEIRMKAGKMLTETLVGRPNFEADDQSALVYLMIFDDPKWKLKTHLEWEFYLHGYWKQVVYNYEDMMENNKPGFGDERWPFVTHFVGCKPCKFGVTPEADECFKQMERAFNFGDNQVLGKYGYAHRSLESSKTIRVRKETNDPLSLGFIEDQSERELVLGDQEKRHQAHVKRKATRTETRKASRIATGKATV